MQDQILFYFLKTFSNFFLYIIIIVLDYILPSLELVKKIKLFTV
jgi:hypothetical protein